MIFKTVIDFFYEERPATVTWEPQEGECRLVAVELEHLIERRWRPDGVRRRWQERRAVDVLRILSEEQIEELTGRIERSAVTEDAGEDFDSMD